VDRLRDSNVTSVALAGTAGLDAVSAALPAMRPERLQFLLSAGPAVIYTRAALHPHQLTFIGANSAVRVGYEAHELLENFRLWHSCIHPEDVGRIDAHFDGVLQHDGHVCEYRLLQKDGTYRWLCDEAQLIKDAGGKPLEIAGCLLDITARKKAEAERARGMLQMTDAQSMAHVGSWDWDISNHVVQWSDEQYRIFGVTRGETPITFEKIMGLVHPQDLPVVDEALRRAFEGIRPYHQAVRIIRPDGTQRTISARGVVVRDRDGRPVRMHGTVQDITELKRASDALKHSEERFTAFMRNLPGAAFIRDRDGRYLYANALAALREQPESWQGKTMDDVFPADTAARLKANDQYVLETGQVLQTIETIADQDGMRYWLVSKFPLPDVHGQETLLGGIGIDITEQKRVEEELRKSELQLRRMLEDRERLYQDLHDGIIQTIYAVGFSLEECQRLIEEEQRSNAVRTLGGAIGTLNGAIRDIRQFITGYSGDDMPGRELDAELAELARTIEAAHMLQMQVDVDPSAAAQLTPEQAHHILCVAREAMSNSLRHSRATRASIALKAVAHGIHFEARDDGIGFDLDEVSARGQGLRNITARAGLIGARLKMVSAPGAGTRVVLRLPRRAAHGNTKRRSTASAHRR